jgi:pimeloyl-ACP methyl ester carboxylesterase
LSAARRVVALAASCLFACFGRANADQQQIFRITFQSALLSNFFHQPVPIDAHVLLPDSYYKEPSRRYPVIYVVPAFEGSDEVPESRELEWQRPMRSLGTQFIVVFLQAMVNLDGEAIHTGFADSASSGPWGDALTTEVIPATDRHFRTIASGNARFLFGHSSGGWSVLWLQVNYPDTFNGAWALSPDPVDFHDFLGPDITKPGQNFYVDSAGREYGMCRYDGRDISTLHRFVVGTQGCNLQPQPLPAGQKPWAQRQMDTYDDVFSPAQPGGMPAHLLDRETGAIDPAVAQYWEAHYDITRLLEQRWNVLRPQLRGKLHVFVGADDTFHLEGSVRLMRDVLARIGSDAEFGIAPGADHWQIYDYHGGMIGYAIREMAQRLAP